VDKSRFVKEKSQIPISVSWETGLNRWSGLLEEAMEFKLIGKPVAGKFERIDDKGAFFGKRYTEDEINADDALWEDILANTNMKDLLREKFFSKGSGSLLNLDSIEEEEVE